LARDNPYVAVADEPQYRDEPLPDPSHHVILDELGVVRRWGIGNLDHPLSERSELVRIARVASDAEGDEAKVEDMIGRAVAWLGDDDTRTIEALLGLSSETRGHEVPRRREAALKKAGHKNIDVFRKGLEWRLLFATAVGCRLLLAEARLVSREKRLSSNDKQSILPVIQTLTVKDHRDVARRVSERSIWTGRRTARIEYSDSLRSSYRQGKLH